MKYLNIAKNALKESNVDAISIALRIVLVLIEFYGLLLFYTYFTNHSSSLLADKKLVMYYLFVLCVSSTNLQQFGREINASVKNEQYLNIFKLPMNPFMYYFIRNLGKNAPVAIVMLFISLAAMALMHVPIAIMLLFVPAVAVSLLLSHGIYFTVMECVFFIEHLQVTFFTIIFDFLSGKLVPLSFFPPVLGAAFQIFLPFSYASGALAQKLSLFSVPDTARGIVIAAAWSLFFYVLGSFVWMKGSYSFQERD